MNELTGSFEQVAAESMVADYITTSTRLKILYSALERTSSNHNKSKMITLSHSLLQRKLGFEAQFEDEDIKYVKL